MINTNDFTGTRVRIYFNLHHKVFSIKGKKINRLIGHSDDVYLKDCTFVVSEKGRQRVIATKQKDVHAYVDGILITKEEFTNLNKDESIRWNKVTYNPYKYDSFMKFENDQISPIHKANLVAAMTMGDKPMVVAR